MYLLELVGENDRFAIAEASVAAPTIAPVATGVARAEGIDLGLAERLAFTRRVIEEVAQALTPDDLVADLEGATFDGTGTIAVRARDVRGHAGIASPDVERMVGGVLVDHGYAVDLDDPDREFRVIAAPKDGVSRWFAGWSVRKPDRTFNDRRPTRRPFKQPGTMQPDVARALVNLSQVHAGERLLDPMCGPGSILIEGALIGARIVGIDAQRHMVTGARANLDAFVPHAPANVVQGSATALPIAAADAAVFDAPYGRQSPIAADSAESLVFEALVELSSVVDRCVVVFDRPITSLARDAGWTVLDRFDLRVHRSLTRYVSVLNLS